MRALWVPSWYNLDVGVSIGQRWEWYFEPGQGPAELTFAAGLITPGRCHRRRATVVGIVHPRLGPLARIDTSRFGTYAFELITGATLEVAADGAPGRCDRPGVDIGDWSVVVHLTDVSDPLPEARPARRFLRRAPRSD